MSYLWQKTHYASMGMVFYHRRRQRLPSICREFYKFSGTICTSRVWVHTHENINTNSNKYEFGQWKWLKNFAAKFQFVIIRLTVFSNIYNDCHAQNSPSISLSLFVTVCLMVAATAICNQKSNRKCAFDSHIHSFIRCDKIHSPRPLKMSH